MLSILITKYKNMSYINLLKSKGFPVNNLDKILEPITNKMPNPNNYNGESYRIPLFKELDSFFASANVAPDVAIENTSLLFHRVKFQHRHSPKYFYKWVFIEEKL